MPLAQTKELRVWQENGTALLAEWDPVENTIEKMRGRLLGYRINYHEECCMTEQMALFNQVYGQQTEGMLVGLYPNTKYVITVQVFNEAGYGPKTDPYIQDTLRSPPLEAPQEVNVFVAGSNSVRVKWRGVSTDNREEPLEGYLVRFCTLAY